MERDGIDKCLMHVLPRNQDPYSVMEMGELIEVTLIRNRRNVFDVFIGKRYRSVRVGNILVKCVEDRIPVKSTRTRGNLCDNLTPSEGVLEIPNFEMGSPSHNIPNRVSLGNCDNESGKLKIDFDDLLVEGLQKDWNKKVKRQKKKDKRREKQKRRSTDGPAENRF